MQKIVETAKKFIVRHSSQLTSLQPYVYCNERNTADVAAHFFNYGLRSVQEACWQTDPEDEEKPHWCVTPDIQWVLADADEVRAGQFYVGPWQNKEHARDIWKDIVKGDDEVDGYVSGVGPCEEAGFVLVNAYEHANPGELWDVKQPVVLPCVDPLERLGKMTKHGLDGLECLRRYEEALRTESVGVMNGRQYVPVPAGLVGVVGGVVGGLSPDQVDLAKQAWAIKLSIRREQQRQADVEAARRDALLCDDQDELPNMAYVDA